jgi:hypothetical protein
MNQAEYTLDGLDKMSIDNLKGGRLTAEALHFALKKAFNDPNFSVGDINCNGRYHHYSEVILAEAINDILVAGRSLREIDEMRMDGRLTMDKATEGIMKTSSKVQSKTQLKLRKGQRVTVNNQAGVIDGRYKDMYVIRMNKPISAYGSIRMITLLVAPLEMIVPF